jgi:photosystem II stability/assembly factor-like uncharacterized protein
VRALELLTDGTLIAGCAGTGQIYTSTDGGETWTDRGQLGAETTVYALAEGDAGVVVAGTGPNGKIFRSTNYGASWVEIGQLGAETIIYDIAVTAPNTFTAAGTSAGAVYSVIGYTSTDGGLNWVTANGPSSAMSRLIVASIARSNCDGM